MFNADELTIRICNADEVIDLRHHSLRAGQPRESAIFDGDNESTTHHAAAWLDQRIVGVATLLQRPWQNQPAWQLRGMAVEPGLQRGGVGRALVQFLEQLAQDSTHSRQLWCNARVPASGFYQRLGWIIVSDVFDIPTAGPHLKMTKRLS